MSEEEENINNGLKMTDDSEEKSKVDSQQSLAEPEALNSKSEIKTMEVHHHPQVEKKSFKEYLLEGLMIFLAVTMGFFAENLRENFVEHRNAKEFAVLLIQDLSSDAAEIDNAISMQNLIINAGDSLGVLLKNNSKIISTGKIYFYEYLSMRRWNLVTHDATLQQLKNSGALRYLGNTMLTRKILDYEQAIKVISLMQNRFEPDKIENLNLVHKVFDQSYFNSLDSLLGAIPINLPDKNKGVIMYIQKDYPFLTNEKTVWEQLRNMAYNSSSNYRFEIYFLNAAKQQAFKTIDALTKEYHLEHE